MIRFGEFTLDPDRHRLSSGPKEVHVEPKVFAVIAHLVANRERVVSKEELLEDLWEEKFVSESALTRVIRDARKALGDSSTSPRFIRTVYGKGFIFIGEVDQIPDEPASRTSPPLESDRPSVAVIPFDDLSREKDQGFFCEGLADEIINVLTKIEPLDVMSRMSSFEAGAREKDPMAAGRRLGVSNVLEGSVRMVDQRVRVTVGLVEVASGRTLWSERYDRRSEDIFAIQEDIAERTAESLMGVLGERVQKTIHERPHPDFEAYEYYLKARQLAHQEIRRSLEAARSMYLRATKVQPDFALAWAGIADVLTELYLYFERREEYREEADRVSRKALDLDPTLSEVHWTRALALGIRGRFEEAITEYDTAIALDPKSYGAHYGLGRLLWTTGKREQAVLHFERAAAVRPDDYITPMLLILVSEFKMRPMACPCSAIASSCDSASLALQKPTELIVMIATASPPRNTRPPIVCGRDRGMNWAAASPTSGRESGRTNK